MKQLYHQIHRDFHKLIFLKNLQENKMEEIQEKIFKDLWGLESNDLHEYLNSFQDCLKTKSKVLLIMDDVKEVQVNKLLGIEVNGFNTNGSKVILIGHNWQDFMNVVHEDGKVEMEFLHLEQALELFSHKVFGESKPSYAFVKIAKEMVNACGGLPLSLEVMGSWLCTKHSFILWEEALSRLKRVNFWEVKMKSFGVH